MLIVMTCFRVSFRVCLVRLSTKLYMMGIAIEGLGAESAGVNPVLEVTPNEGDTT